MASHLFMEGLMQVYNGTIDVDSDTLKAIAMKAAYSPAKDDDGIITASEIVATGYTGGFGGAGRKTVSITLNRDDVAFELEVDFSDVAFGALGNGANDTIGSIVLAKEVTSDVLSLAIAKDELTGNVLTNGGTITYSPATEGMFKIAA